MRGGDQGEHPWAPGTPLVRVYLCKPDAPERQQLDASHGGRVEDEELDGGERTDGGGVEVPLGECHVEEQCHACEDACARRQGSRDASMSRRPSESAKGDQFRFICHRYTPPQSYAAHQS